MKTKILTISLILMLGVQIVQSTLTSTPNSGDVPLEDPLGRPEVVVHGFWEDFGEFHEEVPADSALISEDSESKSKSNGSDDSAVDNSVIQMSNVTSPSDMVDAFMRNALHHIPNALTLLDLPPIFDNITLYGLNGIHRTGNAGHSPTSSDVIIGPMTIPRMWLSGRWMQSSYHGYLRGEFTGVHLKLVVLVRSIESIKGYADGIALEFLLDLTWTGGMEDYVGVSELGSNPLLGLGGISNISKISRMSTSSIQETPLVTSKLQNLTSSSPAGLNFLLESRQNVSLVRIIYHGLNSVQLNPTPRVIAVHGACDRSAITPHYESDPPANFWLRRSMAVGPVYQLKVLIFQALQKIFLKAANTPIEDHEDQEDDLDM